VIETREEAIRQPFRRFVDDGLISEAVHVQRAEDKYIARHEEYAQPYAVRTGKTAQSDGTKYAVTGKPIHTITQYRPVEGKPVPLVDKYDEERMVAIKPVPAEGYTQSFTSTVDDYHMTEIRPVPADGYAQSFTGTLDDAGYLEELPTAYEELEEEVYYVR